MGPVSIDSPAPRAHFLVALRDLVTLAKPRITLMVLVTAAGGLWLAPAPEGTPVTAVTWLLTMVGTGLIVSGANALNMYIERDSDRFMRRTQNRPLPSGRMSPGVALAFGLLLSVAAVPLLVAVNLTTAFLAVLANVSYVLAYTPMKPRSHLALFVGAIPGAIPPLLGWTAATARIDVGGLVLFGILFFWQIPHFLAIALFRRRDYEAAGLKVTPNVAGVPATKRAMVNYTAALVATSLLVYPLSIAGRGYLIGAFAIGCVFLAWACAGLGRPDPVGEPTKDRWARSFFGISIVYLLALFVLLAAFRP
jgi:protoheme IX farnesyltransferase